MKKTILRSYAHLIAACGANVQKGQAVIIEAELDQPEFVQMVVEACYRCGASRVIVRWNYQPLTKTHVKYQTLETLGELPDYEEALWRFKAEALPCRIFLLSEDPDGLNGVDREKLNGAQQLKYPLVKPYRDRMENRHQWCIAAVPGVAWAKKLFPDLPKGRAVERLWEAILETSRVDADPVAAWQAHNADLKRRCEKLNAMELRALHYRAANGTDLHVGLIPQACFCGGGETSLQGVFFNPNIPTEEVFTSPMRGRAEGLVCGTMPLCYEGQIIDDFRIRFENGRAVEWHAAKNEALLTKLITMDEGSAYLGECALVPRESPIKKSGLLFYNTLFDENAACHLALGMGFADTIRDFEKYTLDQCREMGVNDSMIHEDFMIGCDDLRIDGETVDGTLVPVFIDGSWAF